MLKVIGLGNILMGDDGIGPVIIRKLEESCEAIQVRPIDAGSDAFTVLDHMLGPEPVLIIDCARMGQKAGTVQKIKIPKNKFIAVELGISLHGYSLSEVWKIARSMGVKNDLSVIGIEPDAMDFNSGLSEVIKKRIPIILQMIVEEAKKYAQ